MQKDLENGARPVQYFQACVVTPLNNIQYSAEMAFHSWQEKKKIFEKNLVIFSPFLDGKVFALTMSSVRFFP